MKVHNLIACCIWLGLTGGCLSAHGASDPKEQWQSCLARASHAQHVRNYKVAQDAYFEAVKIADKNFGSSDFRYVRALSGLVQIFQDQQEWALARQIGTNLNGASPERGQGRGQSLQYRSVSQLEQQWKYPKRPDPFEIDCEIHRLQESGKYAEAEVAALRALSSTEASAGKASIAAADSHVALAMVYVEWARKLASQKQPAKELFDKAVSHYSEALKQYSDIEGSTGSRCFVIEQALKNCRNCASKP